MLLSLHNRKDVSLIIYYYLIPQLLNKIWLEFQMKVAPNHIISLKLNIMVIVFVNYYTKVLSDEDINF